jgi:hypothetical protein
MVRSRKNDSTQVIKALIALIAFVSLKKRASIARTVLPHVLATAARAIDAL